MGEKTEQPSQRRLERAKKEGRSPQSRLFSAGAAALGGLTALGWGQAAFARRLQTWTAQLLSSGPRSVGRVLADALAVWLWAVGPVLGAALVAATAAGLLVTGPLFHVGRLTPRLERVHPGEGFRRLFSMGALLETAKAAVVAALLILLAWRVGAQEAREVLAQVPGAGVGALGRDLDIVEHGVLQCAWLLVALGGLDALLARWRHRRGLMMSVEELKREHRESEGDPVYRARRRALHRQLSQGGPARGVRSASAVVVNPTHVAVALRYADAECDAPYLVAKGAGDAARWLRAEAKSLGIPVVRDVSLARSLIAYDVGEEIPEELYRAAAVVLKIAQEAHADGKSSWGAT